MAEERRKKLAMLDSKRNVKNAEQTIITENLDELGTQQKLHLIQAQQPFSFVTPDCGLIQAQQYCSVLLHLIAGKFGFNNIVQYCYT